MRAAWRRLSGSVCLSEASECLTGVDAGLLPAWACLAQWAASDCWFRGGIAAGWGTWFEARLPDVKVCSLTRQRCTAPATWFACGPPHCPADGFNPALFTEIAQNYVVPHRPGAIDTHVAKYLVGESPLQAVRAAAAGAWQAGANWLAGRLSPARRGWPCGEPAGFVWRSFVATGARA